MRITARVLIVGVLVMGLASYASAQQDVFTFEVTDGVWDLASNWDGPPNETPGPDDKAVIPDNKICRVQGSDEAAEIVQVDAGGTLVIDGQTLTIDTDGDGTNDTPKLTVNGKVKFEGTDATLVYGNTGLTSIHFVLDGAGTVLADGSNSHNGIIQNKSGTEHVIDIKAPLTLKGSLKILWENVGTGSGNGATFDGRAHYRVDSKLPPAVHSLGEIDDAVSRYAASRLHHVAAQSGFGIGSSVDEVNAITVTFASVTIKQPPAP